MAADSTRDLTMLRDRISRRRARAVRRHQPRDALGGDRPSFRRLLQPVLEAALRVGAGAGADRRGGRSTGCRNGASASPTSCRARRRASTRCARRVRGRRDRAAAKGAAVEAGRRRVGRRDACRALFATAGAAILRSACSASTLEGARVFVLPNPSGRNANFSYAEMLAAVQSLRRLLARQRGNVEP